MKPSCEGRPHNIHVDTAICDAVIGHQTVKRINCGFCVCIRKALYLSQVRYGTDAFRGNWVSATFGVLDGVGGWSLVSRSYTKNLFEKRPYGRERRPK